MTHAGMDPVARAEAGITPGLLRLSVSIEAVGDLLAKLDAALVRAQSPAAQRAVSPQGPGLQ